MKNLEKRNGVYYLRISVGGKTVHRSLSTSDSKVAAARARPMIVEAQADRFTVLDKTKLRKGYPEISDILNVYRAGAVQRGLRDRAVKCAVNALRTIIQRGRGSDAFENLSVAVLTEELVASYVEKSLAAAPVDTLARDRTRRTIRSTLVQGRAIFAKWTLPLYKKFTMPDLAGFRAAGSMKLPKHRYKLPPQDLLDKTLKEGRKLKDADTGLYMCFLLAFDLGLRAGEIAAAQRTWMRQDGNGWRMEITRADAFAPKGDDRRVPMSNDVHDHILAAAGDGDFLLPAHTATERWNLIGRTFADWMRSIGWDKQTFPKAAHELRKWRGSIWYTERSPHVAQRWLGHRSLSTTCDYYADLTRQPDPVGMEV